MRGWGRGCGLRGDDHTAPGLMVVAAIIERQRRALAMMGRGGGMGSKACSDGPLRRLGTTIAWHHPNHVSMSLN
jgi:hypothetical protein